MEERKGAEEEMVERWNRGNGVIGGERVRGRRRRKGGRAERVEKEMREGV